MGRRKQRRVKYLSRAYYASDILLDAKNLRVNEQAPPLMKLTLFFFTFKKIVVNCA